MSYMNTGRKPELFVRVIAGTRMHVGESSTSRAETWSRRLQTRILVVSHVTFTIGDTEGLLTR